jgi:hypothetical protein
VFPPAITVSVAAVYLLATKAGGETRQFKALNSRGMQQLAAGDTADAVESLTAANACYENDLSERGRTKHRGTYQRTSQRLGQISARRSRQAGQPTAQQSPQSHTAPAELSVAPSASPSPRVPFEDSTGNWGYFGPKGDTAIAARFSMAEPFNNCGLAAAADSAGWAFVDTAGTIVLRPFVFDNGPDPFSEGLARFLRDGLFGFFDTCGAVAIEPRFTFVKPFADGVAEYCEGCTLSADGEHTQMSGGVWHRIDRTGAVLPDREQ